MTFNDYIELKEKAVGTNAENCEALKHLLHLIQAKNVAIEHHKAYLQEINEWEKNCAKEVERLIKERTEE